jgi:hypothetical protein
MKRYYDRDRRSENLRQRGIPSKRSSSYCIDYVPAFCTHRPSLLPMEWKDEPAGLLSQDVVEKQLNLFICRKEKS